MKIKGGTGWKKLFTCVKCGQTKKRKYIGRQATRTGGFVDSTCKSCVALPTEASGR